MHGFDLIWTKIRIPPERAEAIERTRLFGKLDDSVRGKLTVVSAPAGFGKSTLLMQWARRLQERGAKVAWLSLDRDDDEIARFLSYLLAAIHAVCPRIGENAIALLHSSPSPPVKSSLAALINELEALDERLVVMLDDVHHLQAPAIVEALESLIAYAPERFHLVLAGRGTLPLASARLKVRGQMVAIEDADLRFDLEETELFFNGRRTLGLAQSDVVLLQHRTEGWAAALQLASLSLERRIERAAFISAFSGNDRDIADFLARDVLSRQPQTVQEFLLKTAILERMCAELCAAVTEGPVARCHALLAEVEQAGLFVVPLDKEQRWYRYHHLFSDFLRSQLTRHYPEMVRPLHRRAAAWHARVGDTAAALHHDLAAGDVDSAADRVESCAMPLIRQSHLLRLNEWLRKLPDAVEARRPRLLLSHVWLHFHMNKPLAAARALRQARRAMRTQIAAGAITPATERAWRAEVLTLAAGAVSAADRSRQARAFAQRWIHELPDDQPFLRGTLMNILGYCHYSLGELEAARSACQAGRASHVRAESVFGVVYSDLILGLAEKAAGNLCEAAQLLLKAQEIATAALGAGSYAEALVAVFQAELLYEWNEVDRAEQRLDEYRPILDDCALVIHETAAVVLAARIAAARGRIDAALAMLDRSLRAAPAVARRSRFLPAVLNEKVRLLLLRRDVAGARYALIAEGIDPDSGGDALLEAGRPGAELALIARARVMIADGRAAQARVLLRDLTARLGAAGRGRRRLQTLLLAALAARTAGDQAAALRSLREALEAAERQGYVRSFVDEGPQLLDLLQRLRAGHGAGRAPPLAPDGLAYLGRLISAFGQQAADGATPFSVRELEIIALLAEGHSNRELSGRLAVAPDTIKWHLKNIYGKLGVTSRTQAIIAAQRRGIC
jgi:LuxR family maltose regulon positive regulatory protein